VNGVLASVIAVCGTLGGSALTYVFARLTAQRAERTAREERLRQERIAACTGFAAAMTVLRQKVIALWFVRQEKADTRKAHTEADEAGAAADHARFELRLLTEDAELLRLADAAFEPIAALGEAADSAELKVHEARSQEILTAFIEAAGRQLR
jgi:hypothetical protein